MKGMLTAADATPSRRAALLGGHLETEGRDPPTAGRASAAPRKTWASVSASSSHMDLSTCGPVPSPTSARRARRRAGLGEPLGGSRQTMTKLKTS